MVVELVTSTLGLLALMVPSDFTPIGPSTPLPLVDKVSIQNPQNGTISWQKGRHQLEEKRTVLGELCEV